jgi:hypothetical protein
MGYVKSESYINSLSMDHKITVKKQSKPIQTLYDALIDVAALIKFLNNRDVGSSDNMSDVINILKIDCKYGIKEV